MSLLIDSWRSCDNQKLKIEKESSFAEQMGIRNGIVSSSIILRFISK